MVEPHHEKYAYYSKQVNDIYNQYTDKVEPFGIDESWLDVSRSLHLFVKNKEKYKGIALYEVAARALADEIREKVKAETGLTISVGVSYNKVLAKLGSDYKKPDATTVITQENYKALLHHLPIRTLFFVGRQSEKKLKELGIKTIGQLAESNPLVVEGVLGKLGIKIHGYANGIDPDPVSSEGTPLENKSMGKGITFKKDLIKEAEIHAGVRYLSESLASQLREKNFKCNTIQVQIKDTSFKAISKQTVLPLSTYLAKDIYDTAIKLIQGFWPKGKPIRLISITASHLSTETCPTQLNFFQKEGKGTDKKQEELEYAMDQIRKKYGKASITIANIMDNDIL